MKSLFFIMGAIFASSAAHAVCPAPPVGAPDELVIQMKKLANGSAAWAATNQVSATVEGSLVWDDANDAIAYCDGTNWVTLDGDASGDNLGSHVATQTLDLNGHSLVSGTLNIASYNEISNSTAFGVDAGLNGSGVSQSAFGFQAGFANTESDQSAFGQKAGYENGGFKQSAFGVSAGQKNTGHSQSAFGFRAGDSNSGVEQSAFGVLAGNANTGIQQSVFGFRAGESNTGGQQSALGMYAGFMNTGDAQSVIGYRAGQENSGSRIVGIGLEATRANTANDVVAIGYQAGKNNARANQFIVQQANVNATPLIQGDFSSGNVGIGTESPSVTLHVLAGTDQISNSYVILNGNTRIHQLTSPYSHLFLGPDQNDAIISDGQGNLGGGLLFRVHDETEPSKYHDAMTIVEDGLVGIGTTAPSSTLHVKGGPNLTAGYSRSLTLESNHPAIQFRGGSDTNNSAFIAYDAQASAEGLKFWIGEANDNMASSDPDFTIKPDGRFGIGDDDPGAQLDVVRGTSAGGTAVFRGTERFSHFNYSSDEHTYIRGGKSNSNIYLNDNGGRVGIGTDNPSNILHVNGTALADGWNVPSDKRLKSNIVQIENALDQISTLTGASFVYTEDNRASLGLIAQDVEKVFPMAVTTSAESTMKSVDYNQLIAPLIEAVKELSSRNKALEMRIEALENEI